MDIFLTARVDILVQLLVTGAELIIRQEIILFEFLFCIEIINKSGCPLTNYRCLF